MDEGQAATGLVSRCVAGRPAHWKGFSFELKPLLLVAGWLRDPEAEEFPELDDFPGEAAAVAACGIMAIGNWP